MTSFSMTAKPMARLIKAGIAAVFLGILYFGYYSANHSIDFPLYYQTGLQLKNQDFNLYHMELKSHGHSFRYAPFFALTLLPLTLLNLKVAAFSWFMLKVCSLFATVWIILKLLDLDNKSFGKICFFSFLVTSGYIIEEFRGGNVHFIVFFLVALAFYFLDKGRSVLPSFLLGVAILVKITPLLFMVYFVLKKRFKICFYVFLSVLFLILSPSLYFGHQTNLNLMKDWVSSISEKTEESGNHSIRGALFRYLNKNDIEPPKFPKVHIVNLPREQVIGIWKFFSFLTILLTGILVLLKREEESHLLSYAILFSAILLLSPHTQRIYFSTLFFPVCLMVAMLVKYPVNPYNRIIKWVLGASFFFNSIGPIIMPGRKAALAYQAHTPYFFSNLLLFFTLAFLIFRFDKFALCQKTLE